MTRGQALMNRAKISRKSKDTLEAHQDKQSEWVDKKSKWSGWGRLAGAVGLGALAVATGGSSLVIGAAAGLGSRLGSEAGENKADRGNIWGKKDDKGKGFKPKKLNKDDVTFYRDEVGQINRDTAKFESDFDMKQNTDAAKDAYTAFNISNVAQAYGGAATKEAAKAGGEAVGKDAARVAAQSPKEGFMSMFSDVKTGAGNLLKGKAKDVVAKKASDVGVDSIINSIVGKVGDTANSIGGAISNYADMSIDDIVAQGADVDMVKTYEKMKATHTFTEGIGWIKNKIDGE